MDETINNFLLAGDQFIAVTHLRQPGAFVGHLLKTKKKYKNLRKQEIHNIFIKTN